MPLQAVEGRGAGLCLLNLWVFSLFSPARISGQVGSPGLTNLWYLSPVGVLGVCGRQKVFLPAWCPLPAPPAACSAVGWHVGPAAHWECLPTRALLRSLMPPGCFGLGMVVPKPLRLVKDHCCFFLLPSRPSLAGDPEPSDDIILLLAREKDLTRLSELEQFQVIF